MIVCSCNVLSDHDVRTAVTEAAPAPRRAYEVYQCLGCNAQCGRCARTISRIMHDALGLEPGCQCCPDGRHGG